MSSTNKTATIELSQYVSTDKPTYLVDYNGDMLKIDNAIADDRDSIATAQSTATTADGKADANKTSIDTINVQLNGDPTDPSDSGLAGDVSSVEGTVNTITALIGNGSPTTSDQTVIGAINGLEGAIAPREDGADLANSYSIGDQFARGGSVYEALASLTAGTAFASLVLNTDYKVADTLVEQIANAGGGALPTGYYISEFEGKVTYTTPDATKTIKDGLYALATALLTKIQSLANDERLLVKWAYIGTYSVEAQNPRDSYTNAATDLDIWCYEYTAVSAQVLQKVVRISTTESSNKGYNIGFVSSGPSININAFEDTVLAEGTTVSITYDVYKPFTT